MDAHSEPKVERSPQRRHGLQPLHCATHIRDGGKCVSRVVAAVQSKDREHAIARELVDGSVMTPHDIRQRSLNGVEDLEDDGECRSSENDVNPRTSVTTMVTRTERGSVTSARGSRLVRSTIPAGRKARKMSSVTSLVTRPRTMCVSQKRA